MNKTTIAVIVVVVIVPLYLISFSMFAKAQDQKQTLNETSLQQQPLQLLQPPPPIMQQPLVETRSESIPGPGPNGDITILSALYPSQSSNNRLDLVGDSQNFRMSFSKQNLSQYYLIGRPGVTKTPTTFNFGVSFAIPMQTGNSVTTLLRYAEGYFNIDKVQEFPQWGERHYYGSGHFHIGDGNWGDNEAIFVETINQPFTYGIHIEGKAD